MLTPLPEESIRVALTVDPELPVPPLHYGGIERIVDMLARGLVARNYQVTVFANSESQTAGQLIPWPGRSSQSKVHTALNAATLARAVFSGKFDIVHSFSRMAYLCPVLPLPIPKLMKSARDHTPIRTFGPRDLARDTQFHRNQPLHHARVEICTSCLTACRSCLS